MESTARIYEIRPRKDQSGFDLISNALVSGPRPYEKAADAIAYAKAHCRSHDALILVYDESGNLITGWEHSKELRERFDDYVKLAWRSSSEWMMETQGQLTKWLFTLHGAGIAGSLGLAHSRGLSCLLIASLVVFVFGIVCLLIWATLMYYFATRRFTALRNDVAKLDAGEITDQDFLAGQNKRNAQLRSCEVIAWLSGIAGLIGLATLIASVVSA